MAKLDQDLAGLFREYSCRRMQEMVKQLNACVSRLSDEQIWQRGGDHENAIGNLVLHLCGNITQWIMHGVGGKPDVRQRAMEFSSRGGLNGAELMELFRGNVEEASAVIAQVSAERLVERTAPQGRDVTVLEAIYQVVGHVQLHVGQAILLTKQMTGTDLDLTIPRPKTSVSDLGSRLGG